MSDPTKHVVFRYNDDDTDTDVEVDILGDLPRYTVGDIVARRGKSWRVIRVLSGEALIGSQPVPSYAVTVTDMAWEEKETSKRIFLTEPYRPGAIR